jgi:phosphoheptose isomerase
MLADFENLEKRFYTLVHQPEWKKLQQDFNESDAIFMIGNGGNMAVSSHGAADISRLTNKAAFCLDSQTLGTSITNDHGYDQMFIRWIDLYASKLSGKIVLIGLSGSGSSKNIISTLEWAQEIAGFSCTLISGQKAPSLASSVNEIVLDVEYFHTAEILSLMAVYELIHGCGAKCPTIKAEITRKYMSV